MYGLSSSVDLAFFKGREVVGILVGRFQTIVHFDGDVSLTIEGTCRVGDIECTPGVDAGRHLLSLIGLSVGSARSIDERHLELRFGGGGTLVVLEGDVNFESFTITGPGILVVV